MNSSGHRYETVTEEDANSYWTLVSMRPLELLRSEKRIRHVQLCSNAFDS